MNCFDGPAGQPFVLGREGSKGGKGGRRCDVNVTSHPPSLPPSLPLSLSPTSPSAAPDTAQGRSQRTPHPLHVTMLLLPAFLPFPPSLPPSLSDGAGLPDIESIKALLGGREGGRRCGRGRVGGRRWGRQAGLQIMAVF